ncbi:hypothetical protein [Mameliella sp.]|uniref:hypothetical protein n=1 Tax=Mameliella sp. TaxID=1924940 RepID=UPI003BAAE386
MQRTQYVEALRSTVIHLIEYHGLKWRDAERVFGIASSTLHDFCQGVVPSDKTLRVFAQSPVLPERARHYADVLVNWPDYLAQGRPLPPVIDADRPE